MKYFPNKLIKEIKLSPFKPLTKKYYFGKIKYGTPYFYPRMFNPTILSYRKLELKSPNELEAYNKKYPYIAKQERTKFKNYPMVTRSKNWILQIFGTYHFIELGYPIQISSNTLGWKDKFNSPRFEWSPAFYIFFFNWQFCIWWKSPNNNEDLYWEMYLWWKYYNNENIDNAQSTWGWVDSDTKESTWDPNNIRPNPLFYSRF